MFFFRENSEKQEKDSGTNVVLFSWSRNITVGFMKTYLHRPVKILQFLTSGRVQKCLS